MSRAVFSLILAAVVISLGILWWTAIPLGISGEWTWDRIPAEPDSVWNLIGAGVAATLYVLAVRVGWQRLSRESDRSPSDLEVGAWLTVLVAMGFVWLWIVQEAAPIKNRLGKAAFVLYYSSSSGYFTKARYEEPSPARLLVGYENLMRERDVLHVGTHPPGLFLVFHGLIEVCESSPALAGLLDATEPTSFREACDVIAENSLRAAPPRPLLPLDRRVLWLATLLVMLSASLVVVPLYGVVRLTHDASAAWLAAAFWPTVPAVAMFVPKSDVLYAFIGMMLVWMWLLALTRRSVVLGLIAGMFAWCGLMCSLAFLPVFLFVFLITMTGAWRLNVSTELIASSVASEGGATSRGVVPQVSTWIKRPSWKCVAGALAGLVVPSLLLGWLARVNLLVVWWLNYQNHAGFYEQYSRTYWKWLLVNPVELVFAVGVPVAILAVASVRTLGKSRRIFSDMVAWPMLFVLGTLWLTGKNSGEAARLWILFLPWLVWLAGAVLSEAETKSQGRWIRPAWALLALQMAVSVLTVARVCGFHFEP